MRRMVRLVIVLAFVLASCRGDGGEGTRTLSSMSGASPSMPAGADPPTASPVPQIPTDHDLPPYGQLAETFDYDASEPLGFKEWKGLPVLPGERRVLSKERQGSTSVYSVEYRSSGHTVPAYLVIPDGQGPFPAVLYAHGEGSTLYYFLDDALALARHGYAGLLITGPDSREPYLPIGISWNARQDVRGSVQYAVDLRRGLDLLETLPEIDPGRIGFVGYSAGAWVGAYLAGVEDRIDAYVLMSANRWPCAEASCTGTEYGYGALPPHHELERYLNGTTVLNAVPYLAHNGSAAFLFQAAKDDREGSVATIRALFAAAPGPKTLRWYEGGHSLGWRGVHGPRPRMTRALMFHRAWLRRHV